MTVDFGAGAERRVPSNASARSVSVYRLPAGANSMTKSELIETVAKTLRQPKKLVAETIDLTFEQIARAIREDQRFCMPGFGTFSIRQRKERAGFNPRINERMKIPASRTVGFRPAPDLKKGL
jgi:DNA-binding protein HU-beta